MATLPAAFLVSVFLIAAAILLLLSPMPSWVRRLVGMSLALVGIVYLCDALGLLSMADKAFSLRYSLMGLSSVIIVCIVAWRLGGPKKWKP